MTHIDNLKILNFKNIDELSFNPSRVNIITGKNNSGKTSLLQSIYFSALETSFLIKSSKIKGLRNFVKKGEKYSTLKSNEQEKRIYDSLKVLNPGERAEALSLLQNYLEIEYERYLSKSSTKRLKFFNKEKSESILKDFIEIYIDSTDFTIILDNNALGMIPHNRLRFYRDTYLRNKFIHLSDEKSLRGLNDSFLIFNELFNEPLYLDVNNKDISKRSEKVKFLTEDDKINNPFSYEKIAETKDLEDFIREYNLIDNFYRLDTSGILYKEEDGKEYELPFNSHGEGFLTLINIINSLRKIKDGIFLIEELENHLHPGYINLLIDNIFILAEELNIQVFITTHSYDLIESALDTAENLDLKNYLTIFNLRKEGDKSNIKKFDFEEASKYLNELSLDLRGI